jgi:hypothetical protein
MALLDSLLRQRVQSFLTDQGAPPRAQLSRNYDQILSLMQRRRDDDEFWNPLTELLRDLVSSVVNAKDRQISVPPEARLLALWDVNELARHLRAALPHQSDTAESLNVDESRGPGWAHLTRGLSPHSLGLFLLLSLAACACDTAPVYPAGSGGGSNTGGSTSTGGKSSTGGNPSFACQRDAGKAQATDAGHALPPSCCADTASELWNVIQDSDLTAGDKQVMYACFANLNATWCDGLVETFKNSTPTQIATYLNNLMSCCESRTSTFNSTFAVSLIQGMCTNVIVYKGVTFPS